MSTKIRKYLHFLNIFVLFKELACLLWPERCFLCGSWLKKGEQAAVCSDCVEALKNMYKPENICQKCGRILPLGISSLCGQCASQPPIYFCCRSAFLFNNVVQRLIHAVKFGHNKHICLHIAYLMDARLPKFGGDYLVSWVPVSKQRHRERGFDQAEYIARRFAFMRGYTPSLLLRRIRSTAPQARQAKLKRKKNLHGAFSLLERSFVSGLKIILVDDVFTTGATVAAAAEVLYSAGAEKVVICTFING